MSHALWKRDLMHICKKVSIHVSLRGLRRLTWMNFILFICLFIYLFIFLLLLSYPSKDHSSSVSDQFSNKIGFLWIHNGSIKLLDTMHHGDALSPLLPEHNSFLYLMLKPTFRLATHLILSFLFHCKSRDKAFNYKIYSTTRNFIHS